ncbi:MAG: formylglycine-generating enzyme family protein [Phycisphaerae bacterium]
MANYAKRAGIKNITSTLKLNATVSMKLTLIPPGKFLMGSPEAEQDRWRKLHNATDDLIFRDEGPRHEVTISEPFYMGIYHVTRGQYAAFMAESAVQTKGDILGPDKQINNWQNNECKQTDEHPVVLVSPDNARDFCGWLSKKTSRKVVLPTEAQWEYACRAGSTTAFLWGDDPAKGSGWCNGYDLTARKNDYCYAYPKGGTQRVKTYMGRNAPWYFPWDDGYSFTSPVGQFKSNAFGLFDMLGNAYQLCADYYGDYEAKPQTDPTGPTRSAFRANSAYVARGGSWNESPDGCRTARRTCYFQAKLDIGFRIVVNGDFTSKP